MAEFLEFWGHTMGGVCSGGAKVTKASVDVAPRKTPNRFDSGELRSSISRELKPSTPARNATSKVKF